MTTATESLPEPLLTAARYAARLMGAGMAGMSGKGSARYGYRRALEQHSVALLQLMREVVESTTDGLTLREADVAVYKSRPPKGAMLVVVCDASRPDRPVSVLRSSDILYVLHAERGESDGIIVQLTRPKGGV